MGLKLTGSIECMFDPSHEAEVIENPWIPTDRFWIMAPAFRLYQDGNYRETVKVLTAPSNRAEAQALVDRHNELYNSPLAKALREE